MENQNVNNEFKAGCKVTNNVWATMKAKTDKKTNIITP